MRNNKEHNQGACGMDAASAFAMETLERREFLSVAHAHKPAPAPAPVHKAVVVAKAVVPAKKVAAPVTPVKTVKVIPSPAKVVKVTPPVAPAPVPIMTTGIVYPSLLGSWSGTYLALPFGSPVSFSMKLTNQKNGSAWGTISLSGMGGVSGTMQTTFQTNAAGVVQVYIPTANGQVSFVAGLSANGKQLIGRWSSHVGTTWTVGTFILSKP